MSAREDAVNMGHALDQVAEEKDKLWDVAEQLAKALREHCARHEDCDVAGEALEAWKRMTG